MMRYDFIFAGMGCAGLSLAYRLNQTELRNKKILLIDQAPKNLNDRTWSFWTKKETPFDSIVAKTWDKIAFQSPLFSDEISILPYQYKMIRGIDFYEFALKNLQQNPNIEIVYGNISNIQSQTDGGSLEVNGKIYAGQWIFNSLPPKFSFQKEKFHYLSQHFLGWVIETETDTFNPEVATFMDFRIEQKGEARFFYLLPTSKRQSLVEFTIFSENLLSQAEYESELKMYLKDYLKITNYKIIEIEKGNIPMIDEPLPLRHSAFVINMGSTSGSTKPSTGYTFMNIQKQSDLILNELLQNQTPFYKQPFNAHFRRYDSMLLNIMARNRYPTRDIFAMLFKKHPIERIFRFLDEETNFLEDLKIMASVPSMPFFKALTDDMRKKFV